MKFSSQKFLDLEELRGFNWNQQSTTTEGSLKPQSSKQWVLAQG